MRKFSTSPLAYWNLDFHTFIILNHIKQSVVTLQLEQNCFLLQLLVFNCERFLVLKSPHFINVYVFSYTLCKMINKNSSDKFSFTSKLQTTLSWPEFKEPTVFKDTITPLHMLSAWSRDNVLKSLAPFHLLIVSLSMNV